MSDYGPKRSKGDLIADVLGGIFVAAFIIGLIWVISAGGWAFVSTIRAEKEHNFMLSQYMQEVGFDPTVEHQVVIGETIDGTVSNIEGMISFGFLGGDGYVRGSGQPSSAVKLEIILPDGTYNIMTVPTSKINFFIQESNQARAIFYFVDESVDMVYTDSEYLGRSWIFYGSASPKEVTTPLRETAGWPRFEAHTITEWLEGSYSKIDLYLTLEQKDQILFGT